MNDLKTKISKATKPYLFQNSFMLTDLPDEDRKTIQHHSKTENRKRGDILFRQGTFPVGVYLLQSGKVKIYQGVENGQRQTLYIYSNNDIIGYRQLIAGESNPVSAALLEDSTLALIPAEVFKSLISSSPFFARNVLAALAREFSVWMNRMTIFKQFPVRSRLALALLMLYEQYRLSGTTQNAITITRTELAEYVGATLETVVRNLNSFKMTKLVRINGRQILLDDLEGLLEIVRNQK